MNSVVSIAAVGDRKEAVMAHRCIPRALELANIGQPRSVKLEWIHTSTLAHGPAPLQRFSGIWLVPASPYASIEGALAAVQFAREQGVPFLGSCGGFQHAILEFARHVAHLSDADHTETNPQATTPVISALSCSLAEATGFVNFVPGTRLQQAYGVERAREGYHCRYGVNTAYRQILEQAGLRFSAFDDAGDIRGGELPDHPFFIGTLFQPERSAAQDQPHPLIKRFVQATVERILLGVK